MNLFSQRKGLKPVSPLFQIDSVSTELRSGLWDAFNLSFTDHVSLNSYDNPLDDNSIKNLILKFWHSYFKKPIDTIPDWNDTYFTLRKHFFEAPWHEVYDFIEFAAQSYSIDSFDHYDDVETKRRIEEFVSLCNKVLERENSAYRFVNFEITQITSKEEISAIENATKSKFKNTGIHIRTALTLMSDRKKPDFRNSVKESISAVEATCNGLLGENSQTLGQALNTLEKNDIVKFHKAKKTAFAALYGYTSDTDGIRHALFEESNLDFDDAKFMLVVCSAFCNYLIAKAKN